MSAPTLQRGSDYATLCRTIRAAGLLDRRLPSYCVRAVLALGSYVAVCALVVWLGDSWYQLAVAAVLGLVYTHVAFSAMTQVISRSSRAAAPTTVGRVVGNVLVGLSYGWWVDTHNRHHANPNNEERPGFR